MKRAYILLTVLLVALTCQAQSEAFNEYMAHKGCTVGETYPNYVLEYFNVRLDIYKSDEEKYYEQFLDDYQEVVTLCNEHLSPYYCTPDSVKNDTHNKEYAVYREWNHVLYARVEENGIDGITSLFEKTGAGTAESLKAYYVPRLEVNRQNQEYLNTVISRMYALPLVIDTLFYDYCKASYDLGKTYENCVGLVHSAYWGLVDRDEMGKYFREALEVAPSESAKAILYFSIARSLYRSRPRDDDGRPYRKDTPEYKRWEEDIIACNTNLEMMLERSDTLLNDPNPIVRDYVAQAYYMMGDNYYRLSAVHISLEEIDMAMEYFNKAKQANCPNRWINGREVNVDKRLESAVHVRDRIKGWQKRPKIRTGIKIDGDVFPPKPGIGGFWKQTK